jgi:hypothetical protein
MSDLGIASSACNNLSDVGGGPNHPIPDGVSLVHCQVSRLDRGDGARRRSHASRHGGTRTRPRGYSFGGPTGSQVPAVSPRADPSPGMRGAIRLLNTLLLAEVTTKPAVMGTAGFVPDWTRRVVRSLTGLSVLRARLLVNVRADQQLVMRQT